MSNSQKKTSKKINKSGPMVYCGPTIKGIIHQYTTLINGYPESLKSVVNSYPLIESLIVPVDKFAAMKNALRDPDSAESLIFEKIIKSLKGGK